MMRPKRLILNIVLLGISMLLAGCVVTGEGRESVKLDDVLLTSKHHGTELSEIISIDVQKREEQEAAAHDTLDKAAEEVSEQTEEMALEEPETEWLWLEEGDDDSMFRIEGQAPFYECIDSETGELWLTLYYDTEEKVGSGISYGYGPEGKERVGFRFCKHKEAKESYQKPEMFTYNGVPIEEDYILTDIEDYAEYDEKGNVIFYSYTGKNGLDYWKEYADSGALIRCEINYFYREDGTLYKKEGSWNGSEYGIIGNSMTDYFDVLGRESWSCQGITHGRLDKYYIYEGDSVQPSYCFVFDPGWDAYILEYQKLQ